MKTITLLKTLIILLILPSILTSCEEDKPTVPITNDPISINKIISCQEGGSLGANGYEIFILPGSIPKSLNNENPSATFSIETTTEAPHPLPSFLTSLNNTYIKIGPESFNFRFPIKILFYFGEMPNNMRITDISIAKYNEFTNKWELQITDDMSIENKQIGMSDISLGTYTLVKTPNWNTKSGEKDNKSSGGIRFNKSNSGEPRYWYCLTVKSVTYKYPEQKSHYSVKPGACWSSGSNSLTIYPKNPLHCVVPQGTYELWISKYTVPYPNVWYTYSAPITVTIDQPLVRVGGMDIFDSFEGWKDISLPAPGSGWLQQKPSEIPTETTTVGTGKFQATLTWANSSESNTDIDLHLYGPNDLHVYYGEKEPIGSSFNLDIDWRNEKGNAIENIYSINDSWAKGDYKVTVKHYYGTCPKSCNIRIVNSSTVKTYPITLNTHKEEIEVYKFKVE